MKKIILIILFIVYGYSDYIEKSSEYYDIPYDIVSAVITVESSWVTNAVSHKGAYGLMQITEQCYQHYKELNPYYSKVWISNFDVIKTDWKANINVGCWYLKRVCYEETGNWKDAITAYFWGINSTKSTDKYYNKVCFNMKTKNITNFY